MSQIIRGKVHAYGDHIDTDTIISAKYINSVPMDQLHNHAMESRDPDFPNKVNQGDIMVAGKNFGCGSSREVAPMALRDAGISVIIAESFARIFFRNAINVGLPVLAIGAHSISDGSEVEIDLSKGEVKDVAKDQRYHGSQLPKIVMDIVAEGGLVEYLKKHKDFSLK